MFGKYFLRLLVYRLNGRKAPFAEVQTFITKGEKAKRKVCEERECCERRSTAHFSYKG
jgi:hypothetical protein